MRSPSDTAENFTNLLGVVLTQSLVFATSILGEIWYLITLIRYWNGIKFYLEHNFYILCSSMDLNYSSVKSWWLSIARVTSRHQQPTGIRTWVDSILRVASQRSNGLGQRARPTSKKQTGQLDCHTRNTPGTVSAMTTDACQQQPYICNIY